MSDSDCEEGTTGDRRFVVMGDTIVSDINIADEDQGACLVTVGSAVGSACPICPRTTSIDLDDN